MHSTGGSLCVVLISQIRMEGKRDWRQDPGEECQANNSGSSYVCHLLTQTEESLSVVPEPSRQQHSLKNVTHWGPTFRKSYQTLKDSGTTWDFLQMYMWTQEVSHISNKLPVTLMLPIPGPHSKIGASQSCTEVAALRGVFQGLWTN